MTAAILYNVGQAFLPVIERGEREYLLANLKSVAFARYDRQECLSYASLPFNPSLNNLTPSTKMKIQNAGASSVKG